MFGFEKKGKSATSESPKKEFGEIEQTALEGFSRENENREAEMARSEVRAAASNTGLLERFKPTDASISMYYTIQAVLELAKQNRMSITYEFPGGGEFVVRPHLSNEEVISAVQNH